MEKVIGTIKYKSSDFIVEEVGKEKECKVSKDFFKREKESIPDEVFNKEFIWCDMEKYDIDHFKAIKNLANSLGIKKEDIGYAGAKDKRAWTVQRVSIKGMDKERLMNFFHPKIILKNFVGKKRKIKIGYLVGNNFKITIRDLNKKDAIKVHDKLRQAKKMPNYFGEQRFGSLRKNNVKIGKKILKRDFKGAVESILFDIGNEREDITNARKKIKKNRNFKEAIKYFPKDLRVERSIIYHLSKNEKDFLGALKKVDRKNLLFFVNSVQSKIFNEILKEALESGLDFERSHQRKCILVGYKTKFSKGKLGEIERVVLKKNNLNLEDFNIKEIPFLRIKGGYREAFVEVKIKEVRVEDDEVFKGRKKIFIEFFLPAGSYATKFLEGFFKLRT